MGKSRGSAGRADRSYQATIAETLARNFGVESAIETCRRFHWHDALIVLLAWKYGPEGRRGRRAQRQAALAAAGKPRLSSPRAARTAG
ncbi:MAG: hypothetical protein ACREH3_07115 [Geminicoccales bacterium]